MDLRRYVLSPGGGLITLGLGIWFMAWVIDLYAHINGVIPAGHHGGDALIRVNFPLSGYPLIVLGMILILGTKHFMIRGAIPIFLAAQFIMLDGLAHAFAVNDHISDPQWVIIFGLVTPAQVGLGLALPFIDRDFDKWWLLATGGLLAGYAVTRVVSMPAWGWPEPVEALDIFSKVSEVLTLLCLTPSALAAARGVPPRNIESAAPADAH